MSIPTRAEVAADPNVLFERAPKCPVGDQSIEVSVVGERCVYINNHRVAGGKPWGAVDLSSHALRTTLKDVLSAFNPDEIRAALAEREAERAYYTAFHAQPEEPTA